MPVTYTYPYTQYGGIWKLNAASAAQGAGTWPVPPLAYDPYFYDVTMLLPGNGTNGAQNNTFLDSSANNFTITRNGNTTQGTFSPYGSLWSNYFDGSSYLTFPEQTFSGDFTIEFWFYQTAKSSSYVPAVCSDSGGYNFPIILDYNGSGYIGGYFQSGAPSGDTGAKVFSLNTWTHIAVSRSGSSIKYFVNGSLVLTMSGTTTLLLQKVGGYSTSGFLLNGYLSNVRVTNTALYTSNFTPSTTPLTAVSGTSLLTCQSNRFIDNSSNNFTLTVNGSPSVQRFSPFNPTAPYSASAIGGSGYFDGSGDYLSVSGNPANNLSSGTIQAWVYVSSVTRQYIFTKQVDGTGSYCCLSIGYTLSSGGQAQAGTAGKVYFHSQNSVSNAVSNSTISANTWVHIAAVFTTSDCKIYINGVLDSTTNGDYSIPNVASPTFTGIAASNSGADFTGYIAGLQLSNTALTPTLPTTPPTSDANTLLLTNFTNAGIPDAAMMNDLETVGSASVSTAQSKFGGSSLALLNDSSYLSCSNKNFYFGTGDLTIEFWLFYNSAAPAYGTFFDNGNQGVFVSYGNTSAKLLLYSNNANTQSTVTGFTHGMVNGTWNHVAFVRNGTTGTIYVNGSSIGAYTGITGSFDPLSGYSNAWIGQYTAGPSYSPQTYIDDLRITKGYARYTTNFTPPTYAFQTY